MKFVLVLGFHLLFLLFPSVVIGQDPREISCIQCFTSKRQTRPPLKQEEKNNKKGRFARGLKDDWKNGDTGREGDELEDPWDRNANKKRPFKTCGEWESAGKPKKPYTESNFTAMSEDFKTGCTTACITKYEKFVLVTNYSIYISEELTRGCQNDAKKVTDGCDNDDNEVGKYKYLAKIKTVKERNLKWYNISSCVCTTDYCNAEDNRPKDSVVGKWEMDKGDEKFKGSTGTKIRNSKLLGWIGIATSVWMAMAME